MPTWETNAKFVNANLEIVNWNWNCKLLMPNLEKKSLIDKQWNKQSCTTVTLRNWNEAINCNEEIYFMNAETKDDSPFYSLYFSKSLVNWLVKRVELSF